MNVSTREAARLLGLAHHQTVIKLVERGLLVAEWNNTHTRMQIPMEEIERYNRERRPAHRPRKGTNMGAVKMTWEGGETGYILLPIHEIRGSTTIFRIEDPAEHGAHLLSAADIRGSWDAWVGELIGDDQIVDTLPVGAEAF